MEALFWTSQGAPVLGQKITRQVRARLFQSARPFSVFHYNLLHLVRAQLVVGAHTLVHQQQIFRHRQTSDSARRARLLTARSQWTIEKLATRSGHSYSHAVQQFHALDNRRVIRLQATTVKRVFERVFVHEDQELARVRDVRICFGERCLQFLGYLSLSVDTPKLWNVENSHSPHRLRLESPVLGHVLCGVLANEDSDVRNVPAFVQCVGHFLDHPFLCVLADSLGCFDKNDRHNSSLHSSVTFCTFLPPHI